MSIHTTLRKTFACRGLLRELVAQGAAVLISLLVMYRIFDLGNVDMGVPFNYSGDALQVFLSVKGTVDNGWYLQNPFIGAPQAGQLYDFPSGGIFYFALMKAMGVFSRNWAVLVNIFYLLTYPLTAVTALFTFRRLGFGYGVALVGSLLFAFQPYHLWRGEGHLLLAAYFPLPLALLVVLRVGGDDTPFLRAASDAPANGGRGLRALRPTRALYGALAILLVLSTCEYYYAFFTGLLLFLAGVLASLRQRSIVPFVSAVLLTGTLLFGMALTTLPSQMYWHREGKNRVVAHRGPQEAELYALKPMQLILPADNHRLSRLAKAKRWYDDHTPLVNENRSASLGLIGACGFLLLVACLLLPDHLASRLPPQVRLSSHLNLACLLLSVVGGFGMLFALTISQQIRAYNRLSIFIAFFALTALVSLVDAVSRRYALARGFRFWFYPVLALILLLGLLDQTQDSSSRGLSVPFHDDARFVESIEASVPARSMVFQLPYVPFPENPPVYHMEDYQHLRGYLHSKQLRWSYGAMRERGADRWQKEVTSLPTSQMIGRLQSAGFAGIYVDHDGYPDDARKLERELGKALGRSGPSLESANKRLAFWPLPAAR